MPTADVFLTPYIYLSRICTDPTSIEQQLGSYCYRIGESVRARGKLRELNSGIGQEIEAYQRSSISTHVYDKADKFTH